MINLFWVYLLFVDRMGATDNIYKGQSTFMVELQVNVLYLICISTVFEIIPVRLYPASRISFDLPRQIGKRKETLRAASRFFDPPLIRENG